MTTETGFLYAPIVNHIELDDHRVLAEMTEAAHRQGATLVGDLELFTPEDASYNCAWADGLPYFRCAITRQLPDA